MTRVDKRNLRNGLLFVSPWIVGFAVFNFWPLLRSLWLSFCDYPLLLPPVFIGLDNFGEMWKDRLLWESLGNTLIYAGMALPAWIVVSLALALLLNAGIAAHPFFRAVIFLPSVIPFVAQAILWRGMFNGDYGVVNHLLGLIGINGPNWLGDPSWLIPSVVVMSLWGVGGTVVIYLAALQDVPRELHEAAEIDGAGWWARTWHVTFPMISPVIYFNVIISCIYVLQVFTIPYVMFGEDGGPGRAGLFYTMHIINQGFRSLRMGYACAMGWVLFVMIALLTYFAHRLSEKHVHVRGA